MKNILFHLFIAYPVLIRKMWFKYLLLFYIEKTLLETFNREEISEAEARYIRNFLFDIFDNLASPYITKGSLLKSYSHTINIENLDSYQDLKKNSHFPMSDFNSILSIIGLKIKFSKPLHLYCQDGDYEVLAA